MCCTGRCCRNVLVTPSREGRGEPMAPQEAEASQTLDCIKIIKILQDWKQFEAASSLTHLAREYLLDFLGIEDPCDDVFRVCSMVSCDFPATHDITGHQDTSRNIT